MGGTFGPCLSAPSIPKVPSFGNIYIEEEPSGLLSLTGFFGAKKESCHSSYNPPYIVWSSRDPREGRKNGLKMGANRYDR